MFWQIVKQLFPSVSVPSEKYSPRRFAARKIIFHYSPPLQGIIVNYPMLKKIQPIILQDCRWIFCGMQRVICKDIVPLYFPVITCAQRLLWGLFEDFSKISSKTFQFCEPLLRFSEHFLNESEKHLKNTLNRFRSFKKIS